MIYWKIAASADSFGPYFNRDHYAGLMVLMLPICGMYAVVRRRSDAARTILWFAVLLALCSLLLTGSRGGLISFLVEIAIAAFIIRRYVPNESVNSVSTTAAFGVGVACTLFLWMAPHVIPKRLATVVDVKHWDEMGVADRVQMSRDSLRIFRAHPLDGVGLGGFETAYPQYQSEATDLIIDHPHNDYAEALAETGIAGGLLIVACLGFFFSQAFGNLKNRLKYDVGWIQCSAAIACCGLLTHSAMDFNLHIPANAAWLSVCSALALALPATATMGSQH